MGTSTTTQYVDVDPGGSATAHELLDYTVGANNVPVSLMSTGTTLGYRSFFRPSRMGAATSTEGLTEGDIFGFATLAAVTSSVGQAPTDGSNVFFMEDTTAAKKMVVVK